jgi:hypothetical protein
MNFIVIYVLLDESASHLETKISKPADPRSTNSPKLIVTGALVLSPLDS